jgi:hypothetical protein
VPHAASNTRLEEEIMSKKRIWEYGGIIAGVILIAFGIGALVMGVAGRTEVRNSLQQEFIVGGDDMSPAGISEGITEIKASQQKIAAEQAKAGVPAAERYTFTEVSAPDCDVVGKAIDTGDNAKCFAQYMRIHALEGSSGLVYAQMGRFTAKPDAPAKFTDFAGGTSDPTYAVTDESGQPVSNGARNTWVTETALATALNTSFFAERVALFSVIVGIALLLAGIGFLVIVLIGALRKKEATETGKPKGFKVPQHIA